MFSRTDAGLSSEHIFYDVEWVVYCEGQERADETDSLDEAFWTKTLSENGLSCKCKSAGSKSDLAEIVQKIVDGRIENTLVAMDKDYDDLKGEVLDNPRIFYTDGYSWESDACQEFSVNRVVQLFATIMNCDMIANEFNLFRDYLSTSLKRVLALDFKYINHPDALFNRQKPLSIIETENMGSPTINKAFLLQSAKSMPKHNPAILNAASYAGVCGFKDFFGKAISKIVYHWFVKRTSVLTSRRRVPYESFMIAIIDSMNFGDFAIRRNNHYAQKVAAINS